MMKKNVEVVYIITKLEMGGAQKVCLSLFNGLMQSGCHSYLISGTEGPLVSQLPESSNIILLDSLKRELSLSALWGEIKTFFRLISQLRKLKKENPHLIVHTHSTKAGIVGRWAAFFARIKTRVHTIHGFAFHEHQSKLRWFLIYCAELFTSLITTHFICVSTHDAKTGMQLLPRFKQKHSIIRAGVAWEQFYTPATKLPAAPTEAPFIFGTISCFKPQKNLLDLLSAFELVYQHNTRARLEIIGDGVQRPILEEWISAHNLGHAITLLGWQQDVTPFMKRWQVFTLSSLWEGLPCAVVEARLMHLPVVCYNIGGINEVIYHELNGLLAQVGYWQQLAAYMRRMMDDPSLYHTMHNFPDKLTDFNMSHIVGEHITLYKKLSTPDNYSSY